MVNYRLTKTTPPPVSRRWLRLLYIFYKYFHYFPATIRYMWIENPNIRKDLEEWVGIKTRKQLNDNIQVLKKMGLVYSLGRKYRGMDVYYMISKKGLNRLVLGDIKNPTRYSLIDAKEAERLSKEIDIKLKEIKNEIKYDVAPVLKRIS